MTKMMIGAKAAVLALGIAGAVVSAWADDDDIVLPGQEGKTTGGKAAQVAPAAKYVTPDYLKIPYLSIYYVEPTRMTDENVTIDYFVTDWDNRKVRFDDDSERFDVTLRYSTDCTNWRTREAKGVKSGDGRFDLGKLPEGLYTFSLQSVDKRGVKSRTPPVRTAVTSVHSGPTLVFENSPVKAAAKGAPSCSKCTPRSTNGFVARTCRRTNRASPENFIAGPQTCR